MPRQSYARRASEQVTVWSLVRFIQGEPETLGQYSTELKAIGQAHAIIGKEAKLKQLRHLPDWSPTKEGAKRLLYGRDTLSWHFVVEPYVVDAEAV